VQILDSLYFCYKIPPLGSDKIKATKKAQKLYLWDWSQIDDRGSRFENMVASHLLKFCDFRREVLGYRTELRYIRDDRGREVDFVVIENRKPLFAVECKLSDTAVSPSLLELRSKLSIPKWYQVSLDQEIRIVAPDLVMLDFASFCEDAKLI
jgi:hypothetical protein